MKYSYSDGEYSVVHYHFEIRRQTLYYMMNFIVPCILIAVLTVPVLLLPPESQERQSYGVTVLLSFTILIMMLQVRASIFSVFNLNSNANCSLWNACNAVTKIWSLRDIRVLYYSEHCSFLPGIGKDGCGNYFYFFIISKLKRYIS